MKNSSISNNEIVYDEETGDEISRHLNEEAQNKVDAINELITDLEKLAK